MISSIFARDAHTTSLGNPHVAGLPRKGAGTRRPRLTVPAAVHVDAANREDALAHTPRPQFACFRISHAVDALLPCPRLPQRPFGHNGTTAYRRLRARRPRRPTFPIGQHGKLSAPLAEPTKHIQGKPASPTTGCQPGPNSRHAPDTASRTTPTSRIPGMGRKGEKRQRPPGTHHLPPRSAHLYLSGSRDASLLISPPLTHAF